MISLFDQPDHPHGLPWTHDAFLWRAVYDDGSCLTEDGPDGPHPFGDIEQSRLVSFLLLPQREGLTPHVLHLEPWQRLIFFRKTSIDLDAQTGEELGGPRKVHIYGWQATVSGSNVRHLMGVFDDGCILSCHDESLIVP